MNWKQTIFKITKKKCTNSIFQISWYFEKSKSNKNLKI